MIKNIGLFTFGLCLSLMVSRCNSIYNSEYYIPVDNQAGDAQPLSKDDVIRVVITHNYLDVPPPPTTRLGKFTLLCIGKARNRMAFTKAKLYPFLTHHVRIIIKYCRC